jgi:chromosome segregation ATPase
MLLSLLFAVLKILFYLNISVSPLCSTNVFSHLTFSFFSQVKKELEREHDLRINTEQAYSRIRIKAEEDARILNGDVASSKKLFDDVTHENAELRSEIKKLRTSLNSSDSEVVKLNSRNRSIQEEKESLEVLVRSSHVALLEAEDKIAVLENVLRNVTEELTSARQTIADTQASEVIAVEEAQRAGMEYVMRTRI